MTIKSWTIYIFILIILLTLNLPVAGASDSQLYEFVEEIYESYAAKDFKQVYQAMYPGIRQAVTRDKYIEYQRENFEKYELKISDIKTEEITEFEEIPSDFEEFRGDPKIASFYGVGIVYKMKFRHLGQDIQRQVEKQVYLGLDKEGTLYLFWDPQPIKEDKNEPATDN